MDNSEPDRLEAVARFLELDFNQSSEFQDIVELAATMCDKPVALITLLDAESNWLKIKFGTDIGVMPRETSFCQYGIEEDELLVIGDATKDSRFADNPLVISDPNLRFYAGAPLKLNNGLKLGTLCLFDQTPGALTDAQQKLLTILARQVTFLMELQISRAELGRKILEVESKNDSLMKIAQLQSHQIRQPLTTIMSLIYVIKEGYQAVDEQWLNLFETATTDFDTTIRNIVAETISNKDLRTIRFNKMVEEIDEYAILLLDKDGTVENWNKGAEKIKGYKAHEIIGKNFSVFYTEEDQFRGKPARLIRQAEDVGVAKDEGWRLRKNGTKFWGSIVITAIHDGNGNVIGFTKVTRDLTNISAAREAQTISADMYNLIVEQTQKVAPVGGWELDLLTNTLSWTAITREIHGVGDDYIPRLETGIKFYKAGASRNKITEAVKHAVEEGRGWDLNLRMVTKHGTECWVKTVGKSNFKDGVCTKVYGTLQRLDYDPTTGTRSR